MMHRSKTRDCVLKVANSAFLRMICPFFPQKNQLKDFKRC